jgi:hypothetical protein
MTNGNAQVVFSLTNERGKKLVTTTTPLSLFFAFEKKIVIIIRLLMSIVQRAFIELEM